MLNEILTEGFPSSFPPIKSKLPGRTLNGLISQVQHSPTTNIGYRYRQGRGSCVRVSPFRILQSGSRHLSQSSYKGPTIIHGKHTSTLSKYLDFLRIVFSECTLIVSSVAQKIFIVHIRSRSTSSSVGRTSQLLLYSTVVNLSLLGQNSRRKGGIPPTLGAVFLAYFLHRAFCLLISTPLRISAHRTQHVLCQFDVSATSRHNTYSEYYQETRFYSLIATHIIILQVSISHIRQPPTKYIILNYNALNHHTTLEHYHYLPLSKLR